VAEARPGITRRQDRHQSKTPQETIFFTAFGPKKTGRRKVGTAAQRRVL
jgi:hypothetical protein